MNLKKKLYNLIDQNENKLKDQYECSPNENEHENQVENVCGDIDSQFLVIHCVMLTPTYQIIVSG